MGSKKYMSIYNIPLFDLNYGKDEETAVLSALRSKWISLGPNVEQLEKEFAAMLGAQYAVAVTNCTAALHLALLLVGIKSGDEVLVPALTHVSTVNAVRYVGATPVFVDIVSYECLGFNPEDAKKKITPRTKAMLPVHYGGFACDMDAITGLAKKHGLYVIEDAAHAPGAEYKGRKLGTIGDIGCFSFFSNKNITCAEGGMLVTNYDKYAKQARLLRSHGMTTLSYERAKGHATEYDVIGLGYNYRLDDVRGALALTQLKKLEDDTRVRAVIRGKYEKALREVEEIIVPYQDYKYHTTNYIFPIVLKSSTVQRRDKVRQHLKDAGIQTSVHYPAVHCFSIYEQYRVSLPSTEYVADNLITLPMYFSLKEEQIQYITATLKKLV